MTFYKATDLAQVCTQGHRDTDVLARVCAHTDTHISKDTESKTKIKEASVQRTDHQTNQAHAGEQALKKNSSSTRFT